MFGYVNIHKPELKMKEYYKYRAYYCGLCQVLKEEYGRFGQITLTYDMTFLIILLTSLYESRSKEEQHRCLAHPTKKHWMLTNEISVYGADMNIALTYHKMRDDWQDERKLLGLGGAKLLKRRYRRIEKKYPHKCKVIKESLQQLNECELRNEKDLDVVSRPFGELMGELFVYRDDVWKETLRRMGFYLGKYIYLLDAYEDREKDAKEGSYNPFLAKGKAENQEEQNQEEQNQEEQNHEEQNHEEQCYEILTMMMSECTNEFEKLPLILDAELLRNILYAGVWKKYDDIQQEKQNKGKGQDKQL